MGNNWAIAIGINDYDHHPERQLKYAVRDAELMRDFLCATTQFAADQVVLCQGFEANRGSRTYPTCDNLLRLLRDLHPDRLGQVDRFWFFFSGHGISRNGRNFLITSNCLDEEIDRFALPVDEVVASLRLHQQAEIVLILDACRQKIGSKSVENAIGQQTQEIAQERGITSIFSCSYGEASYEIDAIQHGSFTHALVEGLKETTLPIQLERYLRRRVREINYAHQKPVQTPIVKPESASQAFQSLLPECATVEDINVLMSRAIEAELEENLDTAEDLWWQISEIGASREIRAKVRISINRIRVKRDKLDSRYSEFKTTIDDSSYDSCKEEDLVVQPFSLVQLNNSRQNLIADEDKLSSERGIDYTQLRDLLKAGKWKEADQETERVMLQAVGRAEGDGIPPPELINFPCTDLRIIDALWIKYSNGKFGFSVQKKIYLECGGRLNGAYPGDEVWEEFTEKVGWRSQNKWISYRDVSFDASAPVGHLPPLLFGMWAVMGFVGTAFFFFRTEICKV